MGRKNKYETHVRPHLEEIKQWICDFDEKEIATKRLGIAVSTWEKYKKEHPELVDALKNGKQNLISELKESLKKKAKGYYYEETKTYIRKEGDKEIKTIEKYRKYAHPDTGAIHLLLKNLDDAWRNDDKQTMELKQRSVEVAEKKVKEEEWESVENEDN